MTGFFRSGKRRDTVLFFLRWLKAPHLIGAIAPSGRQLARAMAREVAEIPAGPIVELGGGTGSVTKALLEAGVAPERLVVVERDAHLHLVLRDRFPDLTVLCGDASQLRALLAPLGITQAAAIVSSLPFLSLPKLERDAILVETVALLGEGAPLVQFTYGLVSPIARLRYGLWGRVVARAWLNLPPAAVWRFEPRRAAGANAG